MQSPVLVAFPYNTAIYDITKKIMSRAGRGRALDRAPLRTTPPSGVGMMMALTAKRESETARLSYYNNNNIIPT